MWEPVIPEVSVWRDSCNVYAIAGKNGTVVINAGSGAWLDSLADLPAPPVALLCTHFFRDHSAGALAASRKGIPIYAPEGDREIFTDPAQYFRSRQTYIVYENIWELFAPIEAVPLEGLLADYQAISLAGIDLEVIPLPGVCVNQCGFKMRTAEGKTAIFSAEAIHSPGRMARLGPLQYNYNGLPGAIPAFRSAERLRRHRADLLLPSLGEPILEQVDEALAQLQASLKKLCEGRPEITLTEGGGDIEPVTEHVWRSTAADARTWFVISRTGRVLAIDYGYNTQDFPIFSNLPERKRALLHSLDGLERRFGTRRIDVVLVSHFHDDHVCGIPVLQRLFDTACWAPENFADLLTCPQAHCFPCTWPVPIRVDRRLPLDQTAKWEEYTFHFAPMNGHTRFAALIGFEADNRRFAHTGDQYFFQKGWGVEPVAPFAQNPIFQNHVYRNGALLDGYDLSGDWLMKWRPDIVLQGHQQPYFTDKDFFDRVERWSRDYKTIHRDAMALGEGEAHFDIDSWRGWIWPYRVHLPEPGPVRVRVTVRNPLPDEAELRVSLVGPTGWSGSETRVVVGPRAEVVCELEVVPNGKCRRQPFAAEMSANGRPFGQVAEALMTVGGNSF